MATLSHFVANESLLQRAVPSAVALARYASHLNRICRHPSSDDTPSGNNAAASQPPSLGPWARKISSVHQARPSKIQKRGVHTTHEHNERVVSSVYELSKQEREDFAYTGAFIPILRKSYALPKNINCSTIAEAVDTYGQLGVQAQEVIDMFKDTVGFQVDKLSQQQLVDTSLTLSKLGISQQSELQAQLQRRIKGPLRQALLSQLHFDYMANVNGSHIS